MKYNNLPNLKSRSDALNNGLKAKVSKTQSGCGTIKEFQDENESNSQFS